MSTAEDSPPVNHPGPPSAENMDPTDVPAKALRRQEGNRLTPEQEQLAIEHLPNVRFIAQRIHERLPRHVPIDDLYSAGVAGLMDAFSKFDPSEEVQFHTYAQFRIGNAILETLRTLHGSERELQRKAWLIEQAVQALTADLGRSPTELEIFQELRIDLAAYYLLLCELRGFESGTRYFEHSKRSGEEELINLPNRPEHDPLFRILRAEMLETLTDALIDLSDRERLVMTLYYYEDLTMKEIGLILGELESRVSQIHASAVLHLRARLGHFASEES